MDYIHDWMVDRTHEGLDWAGYGGWVEHLPKDGILTNIIMYYILLGIGGPLNYLFTAGASFWYFFVFRAKEFYPESIPKSALKAQCLHEIWIALSSLPIMAIWMLPFPILAHRGYAKIYHNVSDHGWPYLLLSAFLFIAITDAFIYFMHRGLHHPLVYKKVHKLHHTYRYTTPFSSHAFHPMDGFAQGVPYFYFAFFFPCHNVLFLCMFLFVNVWTVIIHDQVDFGIGTKFVNSTDHHTLHHTDFLFNYGQYFTLWDKVCGSHVDSQATHDLRTGKRLRQSKDRRKVD